MADYNEFLITFMNMRDGLDLIENAMDNGYVLSGEEQRMLVNTYRSAVESQIRLVLKMLDMMEKLGKTGKNP